MNGASRLEPARPKSLAERLAEMFYGDEEISAYNIRQIKEKERMAEQRAGYENAVDKLTAPLPGGNPETPTSADALVGALMSMGGVPSNVARSGLASAPPRPASIRRPANSETALVPVSPQTTPRLAEVVSDGGILNLAFHRSSGGISKDSLRAGLQQSFPDHAVNIEAKQSAFSPDLQVFKVTLWDNKTGRLDYRAADRAQELLGGRMRRERQVPERSSLED